MSRRSSGEIKWSGSHISPSKITVIKKKNIGSLVYVKILIYRKKFWVIKQTIREPRGRFVISKKLEKFLGIKQLDYIISESNVYYKCENPDKSPEVTLNKFLLELKSKKRTVPIHVKNQVRLIYCFRNLFGLSQNVNSSLIVRKTGYNYTVYNLKFSFSPQRMGLSNPVINFWFSGDDYDSFEESMTRLITGKNNVSKKEFISSRKNLDRYFSKVVSVYPDLVWFQSQIINYLIETI